MCFCTLKFTSLTPPLALRQLYNSGTDPGETQTTKKRKKEKKNKKREKKRFWFSYLEATEILVPKERDPWLKQKRKGPLRNTASFIVATVGPNRQPYPLPPSYSCCKCAVQWACNKPGAENKTIHNHIKDSFITFPDPKVCRVRCRDIPIRTVSLTSARVISFALVPALQGSDSSLHRHSTVSPKLQSQKGSLPGTLEKYTETALACHCDWPSELDQDLVLWRPQPRAADTEPELISCATWKLLGHLVLFLPISSVLIAGVQWSAISAFKPQLSVEVILRHNICTYTAAQ